MQRYNEAKHEAGEYPARKIPYGTFVRKPGRKTVFTMGTYCRTERRYELCDTRDINRTVWVNGDALLEVGFTY